MKFDVFEKKNFDDQYIPGFLNKRNLISKTNQNGTVWIWIMDKVEFMFYSVYYLGAMKRGRGMCGTFKAFKLT